jgi:hypothetical protein
MLRLPAERPIAVRACGLEPRDGSQFGSRLLEVDLHDVGDFGGGQRLVSPFEELFRGLRLGAAGEIGVAVGDRGFVGFIGVEAGAR